MKQILQPQIKSEVLYCEECGRNTSHKNGECTKCPEVRKIALKRTILYFVMIIFGMIILGGI